MTEPNIHDHEKRIRTLEENATETRDSIDNLRKTIEISEVRADLRSDMMIKQNQSLMTQNERQATQLESVLKIVTDTKDKESVRKAELDKMKTDGRLKIAGYILGGGGLFALLVELLQAFMK